MNESAPMRDTSEIAAKEKADARRRTRWLTLANFLLILMMSSTWGVEAHNTGRNGRALIFLLLAVYSAVGTFYAAFRLVRIRNS
jgi:hypothetical protein